MAAAEPVPNVKVTGESRYDANASFFFRMAHFFGPEPLPPTRRERVVLAVIGRLQSWLDSIEWSAERCCDALDRRRPAKRYPPHVDGEPYTFKFRPARSRSIENGLSIEWTTEDSDTEEAA